MATEPVVRGGAPSGPLNAALAVPLVYFGLTSLAMLPRAPEVNGAVVVFSCAMLAPAVLLLAHAARAFRQTRLFAALYERHRRLYVTVAICLGLAALPIVATVSSAYGALALSFLVGPLALEAALIVVLASSPGAQRLLLRMLALLAVAGVLANVLAVVA